MGLNNLLVISDLHLGEDLNAGGALRRAQVDETEAALTAFIAHYTAFREEGRPWSLVVNGDMIDFLSVALTPAEAGIEGTEDERNFGFGASEIAARAKLARVMDRHRPFFQALARFVARGNALHLVVGNHDAELYWPTVQADLRAALEQVWAEVAPGAPPVGDAVHIHPWFWYEPGMAWVEHGHQYDVYCSFEDPLTPEDPNHPASLEENLGTAAMRYLGNHLPVNPDATADLSFVEYLHLIAMSRHDTAERFVTGYAAVVRALGTQWLSRLREPERYRARKALRKDRMKAIAQRSGLRLATLERLHNLRRPPVFLDLIRWVRSVMLGRLLLTALALAVIPFVIAMLPWLGWWPAMLLVAVITPLHLWFAWSREDVDPTEDMRRTAARIRKLVQVPIVTFGHSHVPLAHQLGRDGWYFNSGAWAGGAERTNAFTHLVVLRGPDRVRASLCRWHAGESRELRTESPRLRRRVGEVAGAPVV